MVRLLDRAPHVKRVARRVLHAALGNAAVQSIARRVSTQSPHRIVPRDVAAGNILQGRTDNLPVVLVIVIGADETTAADVVNRVAGIQRQTAGFRPVFIADAPVLSAARRYRYPAELLIREGEWDVDVQGGDSWQAYAERKLARVFDAYGATASVTLGVEGLTETAGLVLNALQPVE